MTAKNPILNIEMWVESFIQSSIDVFFNLFICEEENILHNSDLCFYILVQIYLSQRRRRPGEDCTQWEGSKTCWIVLLF